MYKNLYFYVWFLFSILSKWWSNLYFYVCLNLYSQVCKHENVGVISALYAINKIVNYSPNSSSEVIISIENLFLCTFYFVLPQFPPNWLKLSEFHCDQILESLKLFEKLHSISVKINWHWNWRSWGVKNGLI